MNLKIKRELIKNILFSLDVHGLITDPKTAGAELNAMAERLYDRVLAVASGEKLKSEKAGFHDMAIFKKGVTL